MNKAQCKDAVLDQACRRSDVDYDDLGLPKEMTIWVDPFEVSCRWQAACLQWYIEICGSLIYSWWLVSPRYGEKSSPFCVAPLESHPDDGEFSRWINSAVEKASSDYHSGSSSDEESGTCNSSVNSSLSSGSSLSEHKSIPTVSNPNSVYQVSQRPLVSAGSTVVPVTHRLHGSYQIHRVNWTLKSGFRLCWSAPLVLTTCHVMPVVWRG